jgi:hypothetical protein
MSGDVLFEEFSHVFSQENSEEIVDDIQTKQKVRQFRYSPFALQDAIGEGDKKKMWIEYRVLVMDGIPVDELYFKIIDKARDMLAVKRGLDQGDLSIKHNFVWSKTLAHAKKWDEEKLEKFYGDLVQIYYRTRMGAEQNVFAGFADQDMEIALEKTFLRL